MGLAGERTRPEAIVVPVLGRISAGSPILAAENVEEYLSVPTGFAKDEEHFALRVSGDSMTGAGILDGDVVVIRRQDRAGDGDIVAALLPGPAEDEATVKRLKRRDGRIARPGEPRVRADRDDRRARPGQGGRGPAEALGSAGTGWNLDERTPPCPRPRSSDRSVRSPTNWSA